MTEDVEISCEHVQLSYTNIHDTRGVKYRLIYLECLFGERGGVSGGCSMNPASETPPCVVCVGLFLSLWL